MEPEIFFGLEELAKLLEDEDFRGEEREVMEIVARGLGLSLYLVSPRFARDKRVPASLPYQGARATKASVVSGLERLLKENDRLSAYADYLASLKAAPAALPPPFRPKADA